MKIDATFLRSKVGRRILILFVSSASLPIAALALLSFQQVSQQLYADGQQRLHRDTKTIGLAILEKLYSMETELRIIAAKLETRSASSVGGRIDASGARLRSRFKALALTTGGRPLPLVGDIKDLPSINDAQLRHLGADKALLLSRHPLGSPSQLLLALAFDPRHPEQGALIGEINNKALWNLDIAGTDSFCVLDDEGQSLYCSQPLPAASRQKVIHELTRASSGYFKWQHHGRRYLTSFWSLFLEPGFYTPRWTVILTETEANVLAAMDHFRAVFPPVTLMSLLIAIWLSIGQIRKHLNPLESLMEATRRVANRDFGSPVKIRSGDEFETLGHAFNQMATRLGKQFATLAAMAEIDRIILSASDAQYIVETLLKRMSDVIACDLAYVAKGDTEDPTKLHLYIHDDRAEGEIRTETVVLKADEGRSLVSHYSGHLVFDGQDTLPSYLESISRLGARHFLVLPVVLKGELAAIIGLGFRHQPRLADEDLGRARELADRAAVALSNAAWEERLYHHAHYDGLTDLPNRLLLKDRLHQAIERAKREDTRIAILFVDLDHFKRLNDSLGHSSGDQLLIAVAHSLTTCVRSADTVVRFGGDEFIIIIPDLKGHHEGLSTVTLIADKILATVTEPFTLGAHEISSSASIGIALYPGDGTNAEDLMKNADAAMYHAKNMGKGNYQFYAQELNATALERLKMQSSLTGALERGEFILHYQPRVDVPTGEIIGAEALLRWQHPELGRVPPAKFIPLAEETGLIEPIGKWVLRAACAQNKAWQEQGLPKIRVSVNLSALQFRQAHLSAQVEQALTAAGLLPHYLELEITEGIAIHNVEKSVAMLNELRAMGVHLAMDDFGTGYSSLSYLRQFPIHTLKIDQSFIRTIPEDADSTAIAKAIIALAHSLELRALAEGVETSEQYTFLQSLGCNEIQGYFVAPAVPAEEFITLLKGTNRAKGLLAPPITQIAAKAD